MRKRRKQDSGGIETVLCLLCIGVFLSALGVAVEDSPGYREGTVLVVYIGSIVCTVWGLCAYILYAVDSWIK